jgi:RNA polymerase sigma-70 factor (ECF subfamily)
VCRTDEECIRDCLGEHPEAFRLLVSRHQTALWGYLRGQLGNEEEASEAAQETFVRAYFSLRDLKKPGSFPAWLFGIANRVVMETRRANKRRKCAALNEQYSAESPPQPGENRDWEVTAAVGRLPDLYREVVLLRFFSGLSCDEIGQSLGVPLGTITKRLSRAYGLLREILREDNTPANREVKS